MFLGETEKAVGEKAMPRALYYQRMPFWFSVKLDPSSASRIRWEAYVDSFMMGTR